MDEPGAFSLGDLALTTAGIQLGPVVTNLQGLSGLALQARFAFGGIPGGGGATCLAFVQTSLDQGQTWCDVACFAFGQAGAVKAVGLDGAAAAGQIILPTDGALANDTAVNGLLGDQWRLKAEVTGAYNNSTLLSVWGVAR